MFGTVTGNEISGIFGSYTSEISKDNLIEVATKDEVKLGKATIRTVIEGNKTEDFEIELINIDKNSDTKNLLFEIKDERLLNKTGGNIVQVFSSIEKALFDKKKLKEELRNLTVSSNLIVKILLSLPFVFVLIIYIMNPAYFDPFFESALGYVALAMIFVILLLYVFFLQKIMKVKV